MALVEYGDIKLDIRKATNADAFRREKYINRLKVRFGDDDGMYGYAILFARIATQGKDSVNLPFNLTDNPQDDDIDKAFDLFMEMDEEFGNACWTALTSLNKPVEPAMAPEGLGDDPDPNSSSAAKKSKTRGADGGQE